MDFEENFERIGKSIGSIESIGKKQQHMDILDVKSDIRS